MSSSSREKNESQEVAVMVFRRVTSLAREASQFAVDQSGPVLAVGERETDPVQAWPGEAGPDRLGWSLISRFETSSSL